MMDPDLKFGLKVTVIATVMIILAIVLTEIWK